MPIPRDLTLKQFHNACQRAGFTPVQFMGYYDLGITGHRVWVSIWNRGTRRNQLAFLLRERDRFSANIKAREKASS
jgi:hypothetical protein